MKNRRKKRIDMFVRADKDTIGNNNWDQVASTEGFYVLEKRKLSFEVTEINLCISVYLDRSFKFVTMNLSKINTQ